MKKVKFGASIFMLICIISIASGCGQNQTKKDTKIRIMSVAGFGPPQGVVMVKNNTLQEKVGKEYKIETSINVLPNDFFKELQQGKHDLVFTQYPSLSYFAEGSPLSGKNYVMIANLGNGDPLQLFVRPGIKSLKDLDQKTVGIMDGYYNYAVLLSKTLKQEGLEIADNGGSVKLKYGTIMNLYSQFNGGGIDGIFIIPQLNQGYKSILTYDEMAYNGAPAMCLLIRKTFLQNNPEAVGKILQATIETTEWVEKNPAEAANIMWGALTNYGGNRFPFKKEDMVEAYANTKWTVYPDVKFLDEIWAYMHKAGKKPYPMKDTVDFSYLDEQLKEKKMLSVSKYQEKNYGPLH